MKRHLSLLILLLIPEYVTVTRDDTTKVESTTAATHKVFRFDSTFSLFYLSNYQLLTLFLLSMV